MKFPTTKQKGLSICFKKDNPCSMDTNILYCLGDSANVVNPRRKVALPKLNEF